MNPNSLSNLSFQPYLAKDFNFRIRLIDKYNHYTVAIAIKFAGAKPLVKASNS
jgi:hypothetical protein